jgi:hypothetical protein
MLLSAHHRTGISPDRTQRRDQGTQQRGDETQDNRNREGERIGWLDSGQQAFQ